MKFTCPTDLTKCADKDAVTLPLEYVWLKNDHLTATNGRIAVAVPVGINGDDKEDDLPLPAGTTKPNVEFEKESNIWKTRTPAQKKKGGESLHVAPEPGSRFPDVPNVFQKVDNNCTQITLDPEYLFAVAKAICTKDPETKRLRPITLFIRNEGEQVSVLGSDGIGCIMPITDSRTGDDFNCRLNDFQS